MKELSIEEKAERYDEVIEGIQEILSTGEDSIKMSRLQLRLQGILPELKENADEKIRKNLITFFKEEYGTNSNARFAGIKVKDVIAWLEKQGELDDNIITRDDEILQAISVGLTDVVEDAGWSDFGGIPIEEIQDFLEKQGTPKEFTVTSEAKVGNGNIEALVTDKVQLPKFKVGDWICNDMCNVQIASIENGLYYFDEDDGLSIAFVDEHYHLWTIEDAKDGDVLVHDGCTFIFMGVKNGVVLALEEGANPVCFGSKNEDYCPATKEQRDILFKEMADAGYTFDFYKKELKKIK